MSYFIRNLTVVLSIVNVTSGIFIVNLLNTLNIRITNTQELKLVLIFGMPILLFISFTWLDMQPAKNMSSLAAQSIGQLAVFLAPYWWVANHIL